MTHFTPEELKVKLNLREYQLEMIDWVTTMLRPLEDNDIYLKYCQQDCPQVTTQEISLVLDSLSPYVLLGTPAHDLGHHVRDALGGSAILARDLFLRSGYSNETNAAFWAAMFHDAATGVLHRYGEHWGLNHGEVMAFIFYNITSDMIAEPVRRLAAYAIAAHPHMLKPMVAKNGDTRLPWNDQLFYFQGRPVRIAPWVTRWTDRLENGGDPATHLLRHALAATDGALVGGMDLASVNWYSFADQLKYLFYPEATNIEVLVDGQTKKIPTMLQHLQSYRQSADPRKWSAYNQHDSLSPSMIYLMGWKSKKSVEFVDIVTNTTGDPDFQFFVKLMTMGSGYPISESGLKAINMVRDLWQLNTPEDRSHWAQGFLFAQTSYYEWLALLETEIRLSTDPTIKAFAPLVPELIAKVTTF